MTTPGAGGRGDGEPVDGQPAAATARVRLHSPGYLRLLVVAALIGIPVSFAAFAFLVFVHELEHAVWHSWPHSLGYTDPPPWWPIAVIGLAGVVVGLAVKHLPGHGGHVPVDGLGGGATAPRILPGVMLAAGASLVGGAVVGPEAPLIALGSGLTLLAVGRSKVGADPTSATIIAAAGSAAAISAIFGNPLVAAVVFLEVLGLARRQMMLVVLPCLLSSGIGALLFTGLGRWTGLEIGALAIPHLQADRLDLLDVAWAVPLALVTATGTWAVFGLGRRTARLAGAHGLVVTVGAGVVAGASACVYTLLTGRSPVEVALSGQATLPALAADPSAWSTGALVALLICKGVAYGVCLGTFRGGAVFPALFLGAALGVLGSALVPSISLLPALATGMAAGVAVVGLPVTGVVIVVLLLGDAAASQMPIVILAVVAAMVVEELLSSARHEPPATLAAEPSVPTGMSP